MSPNNEMELVFNDITEEQLIETRWYKPKEGEDAINTVRVLPPWKANAMYYKPYYVHYNLQKLVQYGLRVEGWNVETCFTSLGQHEQCPICELSLDARALAESTDDPELAALASDLRRKAAFISNIVNLSDKSHPVVVWRYGKMVLDDLKQIFASKGNITHPVTGRNLQITKRVQPGFKFSITKVMMDDPQDISQEFMSKYVNEMVDLDSVIVYSDKDVVSDKLDQVSFTTPLSLIKEQAEAPSIESADAFVYPGATKVSDTDAKSEDDIFKALEND